MISHITQRLRMVADLASTGFTPIDRIRMAVAFVAFGRAERARRPISARVDCHGRPLELLFTNRTDFWGAKYIFSGVGYGRATHPSPAVILDVGANIGYSSLYLAERFPDCIVHAIEPDPGNFARLVENCGHHPRIKAHQMGLAGEAGELPLYMKQGRHMSSSFVPRDGYDIEVRVPILTLDQFCEREGIGDIGLLKVDVEGYETEVLKGLSNPQRVKQYAGELHFDLMDKPLEWFEKRLNLKLNANRKGDRALVHAVRA